MITAFSEAVLETLETLIAPGGRTRVSPFVESAQAAMLFPGSYQELKSIRNIDGVIRANSPVIERLASVWGKFCDDKNFGDAKWYRQQDFLDFYLAYYFPVNVAKLQINLLQYIRREGRFPAELHVIDVGVGTGTTIIAVADFLLAWDSAARLHGLSIPVSSLTYTGIDRSEDALQKGMQAANAYLEVLQASNQVGPLVGTEVAKGLANAQWIHGDAGDKLLSSKFSSANLMVVSYVLNELENDAKRVSTVEQSLRMSNEAILLLLEPGGKATATNLMGLRAQLLTRHRNAFSSTGPCGDLASAEKLEPSCSQCWNARQESLAEPRIYRALRKEFQKRNADRRAFDEFQNRLLSWSYVWMTRGIPTQIVPKSVDRRGADDVAGTWPETAVLHYRRRIHGAAQVPARNIQAASTQAPIDYGLINDALKRGKDAGIDTSDIHKAIKEKRPEDAEDLARNLLSDSSLTASDKDPYVPERGPDDGRSSQEKLLFCWHPRGGVPYEVVLPRPTGHQLPKLVHGDEVTIANAWYQKDRRLKVTLGIDKDTVLHRSTFAGSTEKFCSPEILDSLACRFFGFESLRPFQRKVISRVLSHKNILAIAATGSGKSECFILPAMLSKGITIVVSPLLSLMTDQYEQRIRQRYGLDFLATVFNGSLKLNEKEARLKRLELGYYKLAYFTPEQLERDYILDSLRRANKAVGITYLVTDEAHCIAQWGHDFRPAYLNLYTRLRKLGITPVRIALTATASPNVRKDICEELELENRAIEDGGDIYLESSNRPELNLIVRAVKDTEEKTEDMVSRLHALKKANKNNARPGAAIVFTPLTGGDPDHVNYRELIQQPNGGRYSAGVAKLGSYLERNLEERVSIYHSKMDMDEDKGAGPTYDTPPLGDLSGRTRRGEQRAFIEGDTDVMVATKGFGMGIDKDNIRLVLHRSPPSNLEAYAQEAGRAGRDGDIADVVLFYSPDKPADGDGRSNRFASSDHDIQSFFLSNKYIRSIDVELFNAMFRSAKSTHCGSFYFKTTDVIEFAEKGKVNSEALGLSEPFEWPKFEDFPYRFSGRDEHLKILARGHWFDQVSNYVDRILQALYRIRPDICGVRRAFLSKVDECGTEIVWPNGGGRLLAREVLGSNSYFGQAMRAAKLTEQELRDLTLGSSSTSALAVRLKLSLRETHSLLQDVKAAEEQRPLANFRWIQVPRDPPDLARWRSSYGASSLKKSKQNTRWLTVDDLFSWEAMTRPRGWEVHVGDGYSDVEFDAFLSGFSELHDERERNDRNSYQRLLTDYIGVTPAGELRETGDERQCLRAVLLGYLGTNEVVVDGNCRSCSNCVPAEVTLQGFSLEDRKQVVVRMVPELAALFDSLKLQMESIASHDLVAQLFDSISDEEAAGRSLRGYFAGWSGKILDEAPEHRTGLWLRLEGTRRKLLPLDPEQFVSHAGVIARAGSDDERERLAELLLDLEPQLLATPKALPAYAKVLERVGRARDASRILGQIARSVAFDVTTRSQAATELRRLHDTGGKLDDPEAWRGWTLLAALLEGDIGRATQLYGDATGGYRVEEVLELARTIELPPKRASLWFGWASRGDGRVAVVAAIFAEPDAIEELREWGSRAKGIYDLIAYTAITVSAIAVAHYFSIGEGTRRPLLVAIIGLDRGLSFPERFIGRVAAAIPASFPTWQSARAEVAQLVPGGDAIAAAKRLLPSICTSETSGALAAEMAGLLLAASNDGESTLHVMEAIAELGDEPLKACAPAFLEAVSRVQDIDKKDLARVLDPSGGAVRARGGLARQILQLLRQSVRLGGPSLVEHAEAVETLATLVPDCLVATLSKITEISSQHLDRTPLWLKALTCVRDREEDATGELALWLEIADTTPLAAVELSRALRLVATESKLSTLADKVTAAKRLVGGNALGLHLADALSVVVKKVPLGEFSDFAEGLLDVPDFWIAAWVAWLSANPAITNFQCTLKRNERWAAAMRQAAEPSKLLILKYLPSEFIETSPEFRRLVCASLGTSREAVATIAQWLRNGINVTVAEEQMIKAFVSLGPDSPIAKGDADDMWVLFERHGEPAFVDSNVGIERWIFAVGGGEPKVVEARLNMLVSLLTKTLLDKALVRVISKLRSAIENAAIGEDAKERVRVRLRSSIRTLASSDQFLQL